VFVFFAESFNTLKELGRLIKINKNGTATEHQAMALGTTNHLQLSQVHRFCHCSFCQILSQSKLNLSEEWFYVLCFCVNFIKWTSVASKWSIKNSSFVRWKKTLANQCWYIGIGGDFKPEVVELSQSLKHSDAAFSSN